MLTREQASAIWCPMARGERMSASCRCIADECAMWRWAEVMHERRPRVVPDPSFGPGGKRVIEVVVPVPTRGFCGLAGTPMTIVGEEP